MPKRIVRRMIRSLNAPAHRYPPDPRALFVLLLCITSGVPLIFANATPGSIAARLDAPYVVAWGVMLTGGATLTLVGALRQSVNGVVAEQVGSVALGSACLIYVAAIWLSVQWRGTVNMSLLLGFGLASLWRFFQLRAYLRTVEDLAQELRAEGGE
jgi:hypothetical protein